MADNWDGIVEAATREGQVTIYSGQATELLDEVKKGFEAKYPGIEVNIVRALDSELAVKVEAESKTGNGVADVFVSTSVPWLTKNKDLYSEPVGPSFDAPEYNRAENIADEGYFVTNAAVLTFGWNVNQLSGGIKSYADLLDPSLAGGKVGVKKPAGTPDLAFYNYLKATYGDDYLEKLAALHPRQYASALPMAQALTAGEIAAGNYVQPLIDEMASGAPVDWTVEDTLWGARFYGTIVKSAPHPNAANLLADYLVTREGQTAISRKAASVLPGIEGAVGVVGDIPVIDPAELTDEKLRAFLDEWDELFRA
ncbi:ABC transporter substrate-binding protein [Rhodococcus wratislaviensis]|uniref:ABC transporter substrate-binding protein n=1 Tax=Rhodococcus wratislaviensis TaxID=44752 RepID=UPI00138E097B|nr:extracellular solute-binding protein [Rhodococcus wratislaviensis]